jgi:hypothetical protein
MNSKRFSKKRIRGWIPKEFSLPSHQRIGMVNHFVRLHLLRLTYALMLGALLVAPFGVYHSRSEPYIIGYLWGYHLPIGYVGLLLGILVAMYPRLHVQKSVRLSSLMALIGLTLLLSLVFSPTDYVINLIHGTSFGGAQIDVDFAIGSSIAVWLSLFSTVFGLVSLAFSLHGYLKRRAREHPQELKR